MMECKVCGKPNESCFSGEILDKYKIKYYHCLNCNFLQTEDPFWLDEAYSNSINYSDTGYMVRNIFYAKKLTILMYLLFGRNGRFLDYAGGYGVFVRLMRDIGFDFCWDDKYTSNLFSVGFEWKKESPVDAITLFEVFEHFVEPMKEIERLLDISDTIILSTELHSEPLLKPNEWWYYGLEHGQHISFYSKETFEYIAKHFELNYVCLGTIHILSKNKIPYWKVVASNLSKLGLDRILRKLLTSKTWSDYELMSKVKK